MRPVKQAGVVSTHAVLYFAPPAASVGAGAALTLLQVSREGFFFLSACMLAHAYAGLNRAGLRRFYWRRFLSVGIPYLCWTVIYFLYLLPTSHYASPAAALENLARLAYTGYYQLYFLLVIMQFYLVFPLVLLLLRRTRGHRGRGSGPAGGLDRDALAVPAASAGQVRAAGRAELPAVPGRRLRRRLPSRSGARVGVPGTPG